MTLASHQKVQILVVSYWHKKRQLVPQCRGREGDRLQNLNDN